jgi:hypothetical protein
MRVVINGRLMDVEEGATVEGIRKHRPDLGRHQFVKKDRKGGKVLGDKEKLREGDEITLIPPIVKGTDRQRLDAEVALLRRALTSRSEVAVGSKTIGGQKYTGVLIKNVRGDERKFNVTCSDMLFLLPPQYPALPPIGCYLNYKWSTSDRHFILGRAHGAPSLVEKGWYWYCVGLGGGFDANAAHSWRPGTQPDNGHNLATLFVAAEYAINTDHE